MTEPARYACTIVRASGAPPRRAGLAWPVGETGAVLTDAQMALIEADQGYAVRLAAPAEAAKLLKLSNLPNDPQGRGSPGERHEPGRDDPQGRGSPGERHEPALAEAAKLLKLSNLPGENPSPEPARRNVEVPARGTGRAGATRKPKAKP